MPAHRHLLKALPAFNGDHHRAILVHDVHRAEIPTVDLYGFAMVGGRKSFALIQRIGFNQITVGNVPLKRFDPFPRYDIGAVGFAGVQLDADFACDPFIDSGIDIQQSIDAYIRC